MPVTVYIDQFSAITYGNTSGNLSGRTRGDADVLTVTGSGDILSVVAVGDADSLLRQATGGNDTVTATALFAEAVGDAFTITDCARGGDDVVSASAPGPATAIGDARTISGRGWGGDDQVLASGFGYGDAYLITDQGHGGDDTITNFSGDFAGRSFGDAATMSGSARGGDDLLSVNGFGAAIYGDAETLTDRAQGGDDTLTAPSSTPSFAVAFMYGDGQTLAGRARGGDDVLISGQRANDQMWGDAAVVGPHATTGADRYVFAPQNGDDQIMDFQPGKDLIQLDGFGFSDFQALATHFQSTPDGVLISFDADNGVLVRNVGLNQLHSADFILT
ncbi:hypothetical protein LJR225_002021 [Phenylobacterium sp. LjRoot225]|uniref:hypothetical protein n=1 Tax=Phenylobacterium sp. LjRoot225 TaxID=3342285 RepID=UPI003ECD743D